MSGKTTTHHLIAMQHLPLSEMRIDAILLMIGVNDFLRRLARDESYEPNYLAKPGANMILLEETFTGGTYPYPDDPFFKQTAIWRTARKLKQAILHKADQHNVQDDSGKIYITWRKHRRHAAEIRNTLPDLSSALEAYARNLNRMIDLAKEESVRLIFVTQPTMWRPGLSDELEGLLWLGGIGNFQKESGHVYYSPEALGKGMEQYNNALLEICRERHVECVDLASVLEKDTSVFYDDDHFNESGAKKVSMVLSNYIASQPPFRESAVSSENDRNQNLLR